MNRCRWRWHVECWHDIKSEFLLPFPTTRLLSFSMPAPDLFLGDVRTIFQTTHPSVPSSFDPLICNALRCLFLTWFDVTQTRDAQGRANIAKFSYTFSIRADWLCIGSPRLVGWKKAGNSNMQEIVCTTLYTRSSLEVSAEDQTY